MSRTQNISEATAQKIDSEIHRIIDECYARAQDILTERLADLNVLARGLLEYETLTGDEIIALLKGIPPVRTPYEEPVLPPRGEGPSVPAAGKPRASRPGSDDQSRAPAALSRLNRDREGGFGQPALFCSLMACCALEAGMKILGILNITTDSFSDGGKYLAAEAALAHGAALLAEGADISISARRRRIPMPSRLPPKSRSPGWHR